MSDPDKIVTNKEFLDSLSRMPGIHDKSVADVVRSQDRHEMDAQRAREISIALRKLLDRAGSEEFKRTIEVAIILIEDYEQLLIGAVEAIRGALGD